VKREQGGGGMQEVALHSDSSQLQQQRQTQVRQQQPLKRKLEFGQLTQGDLV